MIHHMSSITNSKLNHFSFSKHIKLNDNHNNSSLTFEFTQKTTITTAHIYPLANPQRIDSSKSKVKEKKTQNQIYTFKAPRTQNQIIKHQQINLKE